MSSTPDDPFAIPGQSGPGSEFLRTHNHSPKKTDGLLVKGRTGGSNAGARRAQQDRAHAGQNPQSQESAEDVQDRVLEIPASEQEPAARDRSSAPTVKLSNPKWDRDRGQYNAKATAAVKVEGSSVGRIGFTMHALLPDGTRERIDEKSSPSNNGHAETLFTLYYPKDPTRENVTSYIFTAKHPDSLEIESGPLHVEPVECQDDPIPAPGEIIGKCSFYTWRYDNFVERHPGCPRKPPVYYLGYGHKYCIRFSTEVHPKLSEVGKKWLDKARVNLQVAIEQELRKNGKIELNSDKFTEFAFASHSDAYWDAGLGSLPLMDLARVGFTPDIKEWLDGRSRAQAYDIGGRLVVVWTKDLDEAMKQRSEEVVEYFKNLLR